MKRELEKRPLLSACLALILGIAAIRCPPLLCLVFPILWASGSLGSRLAVAAFVVVGLLISPLQHNDHILIPSWLDGEYRVVSVPSLSRQGSSCSIEGHAGRFSLFEGGGEPQLAIGDRIHVAAPVDPPKEWQQAFYNRNEMAGTVRADKGTVEMVSRGPAFGQLASEWRASFVRFSDQSLTARAAAAVEALCFNVESGLSDSDTRNLQRSGTIHIISVSGLHVLILAFGLLALLGLLPIPRWAQLFGMIGLLALYAAATGLHPPVLRAIVMAGALSLAYLFRREPDPLSALALAGILYLLWRPGGVFEIGFQLSFVAVAGLSLFAPMPSVGHQPPALRLLEQAKAAGRASLIATLATGPIVAYHFGFFSLVSVFANVLMAITLAPILMLSMLAWSLSALSAPVAAGIMKGAVEPLTGWVLAVADALGTPTWSALRVPEFSPLWLIPYYAGALFLWRRHARQP